MIGKYSNTCLKFHLLKPDSYLQARDMQQAVNDWQSATRRELNLLNERMCFKIQQKEKKKSKTQSTAFKANMTPNNQGHQ